MERYPEITLEELDLYKEHIPRLEYQYFESRNCLVNKEAFNQLPKKNKRKFIKSSSCVISLLKQISM